MTIREPITLSTGRIIEHRALDNGAQEAFCADGIAMTDAEWSEYADILQTR